jgi:DNA-directed RNA polymerase subunit F
MKNKLLTYNEAKEILARHPAPQLTYKEAKEILAESDRRHEEFVRWMQATLEAEGKAKEPYAKLSGDRQ